LGFYTTESLISTWILHLKVGDFDAALLVDADSRPRFKTRRILPDHVPEYATKYWRNTIRHMGHTKLSIFYLLFSTAEGRLR